MPIADGPLGAYFGMFADKFGIEWRIANKRAKLTDEEQRTPNIEFHNPGPTNFHLNPPNKAFSMRLHSL